MIAENMSPKELRELADKKEKENKPTKTGFLKEDLYYFESDSSNGLSFFQTWGIFWLKTVEQMEYLKSLFSSRFKKVLPKGTQFLCYTIDGEDFWYDCINCGVEEMDNSWAEKYLENIKKYES